MIRYQEFFGLNAAPFSLTPDTRFFCALTPHVQALNVLMVALSQHEGFIKITGEVGSGKTLLCRMLLNRLHGHQPYAYIANPALSPTAFKMQLANELGLKLERDSEAQLNGKIERQLLALNQHGHPVVLVIDEAQALPLETLETLRLFSNLETETGKLLHIVLFGQPELDAKLQQPSVRQLLQRIAFSYQLKCLHRQEVQFYLQHRLQTAGYQGKPVFGALVSASLRFFSRGAPRLVNILAQKCLLLAYARQRRHVKLIDTWKAALDTDSARLRLTRLMRPLAVMFALGSASAALAFWSLS